MFRLRLRGRVGVGDGRRTWRVTESSIKERGSSRVEGTGCGATSPAWGSPGLCTGGRVCDRRIRRLGTLTKAGEENE